MALRGRPYRHRPAALPARGDDVAHVGGVDVGSLLAIDLDGDKGRVEQRRDLRVTEGLACHDMAPVTGEITDRDKDRLVFAARLLEGRLAPGIPLDRVAGMQLQVRAGFGCQPPAARFFLVAGLNRPRQQKAAEQTGDCDPPEEKAGTGKVLHHAIKHRLTGLPGQRRKNRLNSIDSTILTIIIEVTGK
jgi:hypothetical protein